MIEILGVIISLCFLISAILTFIYVFVDKTPSKTPNSIENDSENNMSNRAKRTKFENASTIVGILLSMGIFIYFIILNKNEVVSKIVSWILFLLTLYNSSNNLNDFKVLRELLTIKDNTRITCKAILILGMLFSTIYVFIPIYFKRWLCEINGTTIKMQCILATTMIVMLFIIFNLIISEVITLLYIIFKAELIPRVEGGVRKLPVIMFENLPSQKITINSIPVLFILESFYKMLMNIVVISLIPIRMVYCFIREIIILGLKLLNVEFRHGKRSIGTVKVIWTIIKWSAVAALVFVFCYMVISGNFDDRLISCYSFFVGIIVLPIIIGTTMTITSK